MSRLWRASRQVGLFPDHLAVDGSVIAGDPVDRLKHLSGHFNLAVVLSDHFARYTVLAWSAALTSEEEWKAYARHSFASTYGNAAAGWAIRLCATGHRKPRVACAVDAQLVESLRQIPRVVSVQPGLMAAFNARRRTFARKSAWFVVQEPGRLTLGLIAEGRWKLIRSRRAREDWRESLPDLLDREIAISGESACGRVVLHCHDEPPLRLERYQIAERSVN